MIRPLITALAPLASGAAGAAVPLFAAKCPNGLTADSSSKGQIYVSGKLAKVIKRPDGQVTAQSAGVCIDITPRGDQPPRITSTSRDRNVVECEAVAFKASDGAAAGAPPAGREPSAARAGRGRSDATGPVACAEGKGQPTGQCEMGVARDGGASVTVVVTRPDGRKRAIFFDKGKPVSADLSQAGGNMRFRAKKTANGMYPIDAGNEHDEFPESVVFGGRIRVLALLGRPRPNSVRPATRGASGVILRRLLCFAALLATAAGHAEAAVVVPANAIAVEPVVPCFVLPPQGLAFDAKFDCGYVVVPENSAAPAGRRVKLGFLRLKARSATKAPPVFMLAGGPGSSLIQPLTFGLFAPQLLGPLLDDRDVVILDQRGTAHTRPHLDCPDFYGLAWSSYQQGLSEEAATALQRRVLQRCIDGFRTQGIDLAAYNSLAIAADIDAARRALGYGRIVLYGASFGAQIAQHTMRDFPGMLDAVILDGTNSLSRKSWIEDRALDIEFSMKHLDALCRDDARCRQAYDLPALVERAIALFDAGPIGATFTDPKQPGVALPIELHRTDLLSTIYAMQGDKIGVMSLPALLDSMVRDGRASMAATLGQIKGQQLLAQRGATAGGTAILMYLAVVCSDDPARSLDELVTDGVRSCYALLMGQAVARDLIGLCATVGMPELPASTDVDVTTGVPTLILSGGLDVATPTFRSEVVARSLPRARLVVFPDGTHVQLGAVNLCAARIITDFARDPRTSLPLDCVKESRFPGFVLPDGTSSR
jgi:pimeloyl-ACP methyl ester carboxylesterase